jgi:hypothetical protein
MNITLGVLVEVLALAESAPRINKRRHSCNDKSRTKSYNPGLKGGVDAGVGQRG